METRTRPDLAVVVSAFRIAPKRVADFFEWNPGVRVILVSDVARPVPDRAECLIYPNPMDVFNLSATSNFGIRRAGAGIVLKTDIDCILSDRLLAEARAVRPGRGAYWVYRMAPAADRLADAKPWTAGRGTVAMAFSDWDRISGYNERMRAYGVEDGDLERRANRAGIVFQKGSGALWHVAHERGAEHWERNPDFNPKNHAENYVVEREGWSDPAWGLPLASV